jgi:methylated-DNA-protein-cysteine methyltransferase related protein
MQSINIYKIHVFVKVLAILQKTRKPRRFIIELMPNESTTRIITVLKSIPVGKVASYGLVASLAGLSNGARQVVRVLHSSSEKECLPWHRLVRKDGRIALPPGEGFELQRGLLEAEGVEVSREGRIDLERFGWQGRS